MPIEDLRKPLEVACESIKQFRNNPDKFIAQTSVNMGGINSYLPEIQTLIKNVEKTSELSEIFQKHFDIPIQINIFGSIGLSIWLLRQSMNIGLDSALHNLITCIKASEIPIRNINVIEGIKLSRRCDINKDTCLITWDNLEESSQKTDISSIFMNQFHTPSVALVRKYQFLKKFIDTPPQQNDFLQKNVIENNDIILCAGLYGPSGPIISGSWWEVPNWLPHIGYSYRYLLANIKQSNCDWPEEAYNGLPRIYESFNNQQDGYKNYLRISLSRLNSSLQRLNPTDVAIDCRIALESIYLDNNSGEATYKIGLRASRFLSNNISERLEICDNIRALYSAGSEAIHTGKISQEKINSLQSSQELLSRSIKKLILERRKKWKDKDWKDIELR
jgi:hypothetical protein